MNLDALKNQLKEHEGLELLPYMCSEGVLTIGYGRNLESKGISEAEADIMLDNDIDEVIKDMVKIFHQWEHYSEIKQNALADMRFQLGWDGFRSFKKMIKAVQSGEWGKAAAEAFDSKWRRQTPKRAKSIIKMLRCGDN